MAQRQYELGEAELGVLRVLWDDGSGTVRDVLEHLHARGRNVAYTTVQTVLNRLEQKGFVRANKSGMAYIYRPKVTREKVTQSRLKSLVSQLYDGAAGQLVLQLVKTEHLTVAELDQLQRLIEGQGEQS